MKRVKTFPFMSETIASTQLPIVLHNILIYYRAQADH
jgi:hypothetical protein